LAQGDRSISAERTSLLTQVETLTQEVKDERERNRKLRTQLEMVTVTQRTAEQVGRGTVKGQPLLPTTR